MVVYDLRETYHNNGKYEFKVVLDKSFKNGHDISILMLDPNNDMMPVTSEVWGRKVNCTFDITDLVREGVCTVRISLGSTLSETIQYWIIK